METIINFIPVWLRILIIACVVTSLINPLIYFIKYEYKARGEFIRKNEGQRPTVKDFWKDFTEEVTWWWIPIADIFIFIYGILYLIFYPFNKWWKKLINVIKDIKI